MYAIPLVTNQPLPSIPLTGFQSQKDLAALPGVSVIRQEGACPGPDPSVYAFTKVATHRNIYRVPGLDDELDNAKHSQSGFEFGTAGSEMLVRPAPVRSQRKSSRIRGLTALLKLDESSTRTVMLVEAEEFCQVRLCKTRRALDFEKILIVIKYGIAAHVCRTGVNER